MGLFFSAPKKIKQEEFKKTVQEMRNLSDKEKAYIEGVFQDKLKDGGMSKEELRQSVTDLKRNYGDPLTSDKVEKVKQQLEEKLK